MRMPGFTAEESLYKISERYHMALPVGSGSANQRINPAFFLCDWFPWLPGCPKPPGNVYCRHTKTDTYCTGFVFWCKDNSICSDGSTRSSGWYPCGVCIGWG